MSMPSAPSLSVHFLTSSPSSRLILILSSASSHICHMSPRSRTAWWTWEPPFRHVSSASAVAGRGIWGKPSSSSSISAAVAGGVGKEEEVTFVVRSEWHSAVASGGGRVGAQSSTRRRPSASSERAFPPCLVTATEISCWCLCCRVKPVPRCACADVKTISRQVLSANMTQKRRHRQQRSQIVDPCFIRL